MFKKAPPGFKHLSPIPPLIALIGRRMLTHMDRVTRRIGLNSTMALSIAVLKQRPGISQEELGRSLGVDKGHVTRIVRKLIEMDLIERVRDPADGRAFQLFVIDGSPEIMREMMPEILATHDQLLGNLDATERDTLHRLLLKLLANSEGLNDLVAEG